MASNSTRGNRETRSVSPSTTRTRTTTATRNNNATRSSDTRSSNATRIIDLIIQENFLKIETILVITDLMQQDLKVEVPQK